MYSDCTTLQINGKIAQIMTATGYLIPDITYVPHSSIKCLSIALLWPTTTESDCHANNCRLSIKWPDTTGVA